MFATALNERRRKAHSESKRKMKTITTNSRYFNAKDTLECGQIFRFSPLGDGYLVLSADKACVVATKGDTTTIGCEDEDEEYFRNYFDLATDYESINARAKSSGFLILEKAADVGSGVRILRQNPTEMLFSFLVSQNNNIPRIKGIIGKLCDALGEEKRSLGAVRHTFPSLSALKSADLGFYKSIGLGYRAEFFKDLADAVTPSFIDELSECDGITLKKRLLSLRGIGDKVADCVRLFGFYKTDSFPVDVWIEKIYREDFSGTEKNREKISAYFSGLFGADSGFFQQYLFHYKRNLEK